MKKTVLLFLFVILFVNSKAQDLVGGDFGYRNISGLEYETSLSLYSTKPHTFFIISWGDGTKDSVLTPVPSFIGTIYKYDFSKRHTYPGSGNYNPYVFADYLIDSITNLTFSGMMSMSLSAVLIINPSWSADNSPVLLNPPVFHVACCSQFIDNAAAYDPDGDSLSYSLFTYDSTYSLAGATIDSSTGDFLFTPPATGRYLFIIQIHEWRKLGIVSHQIGSIMRTMVFNLDSSTLVEEINSIGNINIFPNPSCNKITISGYNQSEKEANLEIRNIFGEKVLQSKITDPKSEIQLDVSSITSGIYFITLSDGERIYRGKMVKN